MLVNNSTKGCRGQVGLGGVGMPPNFERGVKFISPPHTLFCQKCRKSCIFKHASNKWDRRVCFETKWRFLACQFLRDFFFYSILVMNPKPTRYKLKSTPIQEDISAVSRDKLSAYLHDYRQHTGRIHSKPSKSYKQMVSVPVIIWPCCRRSSPVVAKQWKPIKRKKDLRLLRQSEAVTWRTDNTMAKGQRTKEQQMIHRTCTTNRK